MKFKVSADDLGSGVGGVEMTLDGVPQGPMEREGRTYVKTLVLEPGPHSWEVVANDNLGNAGEAKVARFTFAIDRQLRPYRTLSYPRVHRFGDVMKVSASVQDDLSGMMEVTLHYSTDSGLTWNQVPMTPPMPPATLYEGTIPSQSPMARVQYYVVATDTLGNAGRSATQEFNVGIPVWVYIAAGVIGVAVAIPLLLRRRMGWRIGLIVSDSYAWIEYFLGSDSGKVVRG